MTISAPLNGVSLLGETYTHNTGGTADAYVLTAIPSVGQTLRLMAAGNATQGISAISQTGVRWRVDTTASALLRCDVWTGYCWSASASATVNVTTLIAAIAQRVTITVHTGLGAWPGVHAVNSASDATGVSTTASTGSITPTAAYDYLVLACARNLSGTAGGAPTGGFSALNSASNGYLFAYKILTAHDGSAVSTSWTIPASNWEASICAIRVTPTISATIDALVTILDASDQSPSGACKIVRDCRVPALTALENGVQIIAGQAHRWNDYRLQSSTLDAIGGAGVDASGYSLVGSQGTGTEYLHGNGSQWMASTAAISTLDLSNTTGFTIIDIVRVTANGGIGGIAASPTAATAPYCMNTVESGTYKMATSLVSAPSIDTGVASGSTWRLIITQKYNKRTGVSGMNAITSGDQMHHVAMGGRVACPQIWGNGLLINSGTLYGAGNNFDVMGRQSTNIATLDHAFHAVINAELTTAQRAAVEAFAVANFGVTLDTSLRTLIGLGASFQWGSDQAGAQVTDPPLRYAVLSATGGAGTLTSRGWENRPFALSNWGISGRTLAMTAEGIATTVLPGAMNTSHPGRNVFVVWDAPFNSMKTLTAAQGETALISLLTQIQAVGGYTLIATLVDSAFMYTGFTNLSTASGISAQGTEVVRASTGYNALIRANWPTYPNCVGCVDLAANINLKPDKWAGVYPNIPASAIGTYYESGAGGHFLNVGYQLIGQIFKDYLDANPGVFGGLNAARRRRR